MEYDAARVRISGWQRIGGNARRIVTKPAVAAAQSGVWEIGKEGTDIKTKVNIFLKNTGNFLLWAYIVIMAAVYPLYLGPEGYVRIGRDKHLFYNNVTVGMLAVMVVVSGLYWLTRPDASKFSKRLYGRFKKCRFSPTELAAAGFITAAVISFAVSPFRETAWVGTEGWNMGLKMLLCVTAVYLLLSRRWKYSGFVWTGFLVGAAAVYFLGICNRFSFYPIPFERVAPEFISTLGNINWFAGYLSVMWPISAGLAVFAENRYVRLGAGAVTVLSFGAGVTQGSSSVFLSFAAGFYLLLLLCIREWKKYGIRWLGLAVGWCLACQVIRILRAVLPGRYNYATDNLCGMVTGGNFSLWLLLAVILLYLVTWALFYRKTFAPEGISRRKSDSGLVKRPESDSGLVKQQEKAPSSSDKQQAKAMQKPEALNWLNKWLLKSAKQQVKLPTEPTARNTTILRRILIILPIMGIIIYVLLTAVNTLSPGGISGLQEDSRFIFDRSWGSGRGATWRIGAEMFARMDLGQKLFGIGPDSFKNYLYSFPDLAEEAAMYYGNAVLANAHNEWITVLVNLGVVGTAAYGGIFITLLFRFIRKGKDNRLFYLPAVCAFSYLIHNLVSFGQVLNMPFLFIIMGIGESGYRQFYNDGRD